MSNEYDAVIIGGGHNGLVTAGYLARAGLHTLVLESRQTVGGACVTEEIFPGYKFSTTSYLCSLMQEKVTRDLELESILDMLPDVITGDQAEALMSLAMEEIRPCDLYDWLSGRLAPTWKESLHNLREAERRKMERGFFPWADVEACRADPERQRLQSEGHEKPELETKPCPSCQKPPEWIWFDSPAWTWEKLCGRAGWLALCDHCHLQIDFHMVLMN